jgi:hypothetical protein
MRDLTPWTAISNPFVTKPFSATHGLSQAGPPGGPRPLSLDSITASPSATAIKALHPTFYRTRTALATRCLGTQPASSCKWLGSSRYPFGQAPPRSIEANLTCTAEIGTGFRLTHCCFPVAQGGNNPVEANPTSIMYAMIEKGLAFTPAPQTSLEQPTVRSRAKCMSNSYSKVHQRFQIAPVPLIF